MATATIATTAAAILAEYRQVPDFQLASAIVAAAKAEGIPLEELVPDGKERGSIQDDAEKHDNERVLRRLFPRGESTLWSPGPRSSVADEDDDGGL